jgi:hypothetical protein
MPSYERELRAAKDATNRARTALETIDRTRLDPPQRRILSALLGDLRRAERAGHWSSWSEDHPIVVVYDATRRALSQIGNLERGLDGDHKRMVDDAIAALHEAEDTLNEPYWRGGLR